MQNSINSHFDVLRILETRNFPMNYELRHASRILRPYAQLYNLLVPGGSLLVCDHVNSPLPSDHRAAHFMTVEEHLAAFKGAGFIMAREIGTAADLSLMQQKSPKINLREIGPGDPETRPQHRSWPAFKKGLAKIQDPIWFFTRVARAMRPVSKPHSHCGISRLTPQELLAFLGDSTPFDVRFCSGTGIALK